MPGAVVLYMHAHLKVDSHHCRTEIPIFEILPLYRNLFTYTTLTFTCCFMYIRVIWTLIYLVLLFLYIGPLSLGEKRGQNCSRLSCPLVREADSRLRVKGYGWAWRGGWTPCLSPVALLIFMFIAVTSPGDVPAHWLKLLFIVNMDQKIKWIVLILDLTSDGFYSW